MKYCPACSKEFEGASICPDDASVLIDPVEPPDPLVGTLLKGTYRIEERVASGGMGVVYRGTQLPIRRAVAIKVLQPQLRKNPEQVKRFFREAQLLGELNHPNILHLIDCGNIDDGTIFLVTEYLSGKPLEEIVPEGTGLPLDEILAIMQQISAGVGAAHRRRLLHRDLKPSNIFVLDDSDAATNVKLLDFGIAKPLADTEAKLTKTGLVLGTPGYVSPEQIKGESEASERSEVYALGAILYFLAVGRAPYSGGTPQSLVVRQLTRPPDTVDLAPLGKPEALRQVILKAMEIDPARRYQGVEELMHALRAVKTGSSTLPMHALGDPPTDTVTPSGRPLGRGSWRTVAIAVAAFMLAGALGAWWSARGARSTGAPFSAKAVRGVTADRITLGMSGPFFGPSRDLGHEMKVGLDTSFAAANAEGGVNGRMVELVALDDGYDPERAASNMRELIDHREVFAVVGSIGTPTAVKALPIALDSKLPFIGAFSGADVLREDPPVRYVINYRASYAEETAAIVGYFVRRKGIAPNEIAVFAQDDAFGESGFRGVARRLRDFGVTDESTILRVGYERNSRNVAEASKTILKHRGKLKAIVMVATYGASAAFIKSVRDGGMTPKFACVSFVGARSLAEELKSFGSEYADGIIVSQVVPHYASNATGVIRYRDLLRRHFPSEEPSFGSLEGFIVGQILLSALKNAGRDLDTERLIDSIESIKDLDLGIGTPISFGPSKHQGSHRVWGTVLDTQGKYQVLELEP